MYKKNMQLAVLAMLSVCYSVYATDGIYKTELMELKKSESHKFIFDKKTNDFLRRIVKDVEINKELTYLQRAARSVFMESGVMVTRDTMPKMYNYIAQLCQKEGIETPVVFISKDTGIFNAFAFKVFVTTGGILIGQDLLKECSDDAIEAIIAHEIGHVYHNHANKHLALKLVATVGVGAATKNPVAAVIGGGLLSSVIIGKSHEKQADQFAYKTGKSQGLIEFFENLKKKEQKEDDDFIATDRVLSDNQPLLSSGDYFSLRLGYYLAKMAHKIDRGFMWVYHNTPLGAHPSHDARIAAAKEYEAKN